MPDLHLAQFVTTLLNWHSANPRSLPWKESNDPYSIWLSEIILQQTQVSQGAPYYLKFIQKYPTVADLARASEDEVLRDWQGLGYNSRARNMLRAARMVVRDHSGIFPDNARDLAGLPGIGGYTSAAIASFAYEEAVPVVDANVIRVMCRILGITADPTTAPVRRKLQDMLQEMILNAQPSEFNQAMMNFGALVCKPRNPGCSNCPFASICKARSSDSVSNIPFKPHKKKRKVRYLHYVVVLNSDGLIMRKRTEDDIWRNMYDFPGFEADSGHRAGESRIQEFVVEELDITDGVLESYQVEKQTLTHREIQAGFYTISTRQTPKARPGSPYTFVEFGNLANFATPKIINCYLRANSIHL